MFDYQATCQVEPPKFADPGDSKYFNKKKPTKEALRTNSSSKKMTLFKSVSEPILNKRNKQTLFNHQRKQTSPIFIHILVASECYRSR